MKDILMITHFTQTPGEAGNGRFDYLARLLSCDNRVEMVTTSFSHRTKQPREITSKQYSELPYRLTLLKEPGYKKNVSLKRFYSHWVFGNSLMKFLQRREKPDVIYCTIPSLDAAWAAARYAKKNNVPFILDIQDLWPEAFRIVFNIPVISDCIFAPMKWKADGIYNTADAVIAVSKTYMNRALKVNQKCKEGHTIFLGTKLEDFDDLAKRKKIRRDEGKFVIGYIGTLGHNYDIRLVIDAIELVEQKGYKTIEFWVMGDGPLRNQFEEYAQKKKVSTLFTGRLQYPDMVQRLCACDVVVNPIVAGSACSITNKHGDYAASGLPVLNTQESKEYRELVEEYQMGFNCENGNSEDLAEKLLKLINDGNMRKIMGKNSRRCAEERFDRGHTYQEILDVILRY